jgi:hypothetical protein
MAPGVALISCAELTGAQQSARGQMPEVSLLQGRYLCPVPLSEPVPSMTYDQPANLDVRSHRTSWWVGMGLYHCQALA